MSSLETEDTAPHPVEVYRNDRHRHAAHDALEAGAETEQIARAGYRSLGEDAHQIAGTQTLPGFAERLNQFSWRIACRNRNRAHELRQPVDSGSVVELAKHKKADVPLRARANQERVHKGDVITHEQRGAVSRQVFTPVHADAIERMRQQPQAQADGGSGQKGQHVGRGYKRDDSHHQQHRIRSDMKHISQHQAPGRGRKDTRKRQDVGGRDDAPLGVFARALLEIGFERHNEESPAHPQQEVAGEGVGKRVRGETKVNGKQAQADRANRHQAELHLVAGEFARQKRADSNPDRDTGIEQSHSPVAQTEQIAPVNQHILQIDCAQEPEVSDAQHRQKQVAARSDFAKVFPKLCNRV